MQRCLRPSMQQTECDCEEYEGQKSRECIENVNMNPSTAASATATYGEPRLSTFENAQQHPVNDQANRLRIGPSDRPTIAAKVPKDETNVC